MAPRRMAMLTLGLLCALNACAPAQRNVGRDAKPDEDPLEANRPASAPGQRPVTPIQTR